MYFPIFVDKNTLQISLVNTGNCAVVLPRKSDGSDGRWMWGKEKCQNDISLLVPKMIKRRGEYDIFVKDYLNKNNSERTRKYKTIWDSKSYNNQFGTQEVKRILEGDYMSFPKSTELISDVIRMGCSNKGIILDFFSGSGTTAHAVMNLNAGDNGSRKFIMVQLQEPTNEKDESYKAGYKNICEIGKERIRRSGDIIQSEMEKDGQTSLELHPKNMQSLDIGFKVFKLDTSNLAKWDPEYANLDQTLLDNVENFVPGRSKLDLIYEIIIKYGIDLTLPIEEFKIHEKIIYSIGFGALMICLDDNITNEIANELIKLKDKLSPEVMRVVFKDNGFASDSDKTNVKETLKSNGIDEFVTI